MYLFNSSIARPQGVWGWNPPLTSRATVGDLHKPTRESLGRNALSHWPVPRCVKVDTGQSIILKAATPVSIAVR